MYKGPMYRGLKLFLLDFYNGMENKKRPRNPYQIRLGDKIVNLSPLFVIIKVAMKKMILG